MSEVSEFLSLNEAASLLGVTKDTLRARITAGELPAYQIGSWGKFRIARSDLQRLLRPVETEIAK